MRSIAGSRIDQFAPSGQPIDIVSEQYAYAFDNQILARNAMRFFECVSDWLRAAPSVWEISPHVPCLRTIDLNKNNIILIPVVEPSIVQVLRNSHACLSCVRRFRIACLDVGQTQPSRKKKRSIKSEAKADIACDIGVTDFGLATTEARTMAETFTGKLEWITMGGNIDVRHPDGRLIRCYGVSREHSKEADRLGKKAFCTVVIPDDSPGRGKFSPHITAVDETPPPQPNLEGDPANKAEAILRIARKMIAAENAHAEKPLNSGDRLELDFLLGELIRFTTTDVDEALRIVRRRRATPSPQTRASVPASLKGDEQ